MNRRHEHTGKPADHGQHQIVTKIGLGVDAHGTVSIDGAGRNIIAVTAGNVVGGTLLVAGVYWVAYLRGERMRKGRSS